MTTFTASELGNMDVRCLVMIDVYFKENPQLPQNQTVEAIEAASTAETAPFNGTKPEITLANAKRAGFSDATIEHLWLIDLQHGRSFTLNPLWWLHEDMAEAEAIFRRDSLYEINTDSGCPSSVDALREAGTVKVKPFLAMSREDVETTDPDRRVYCAAFLAVFKKLHLMTAEDRAHVMAPMQYLLTTSGPGPEPGATTEMRKNMEEMRIGMLRFLRDTVNPEVVFTAEEMLQEQSVENLHFLRFEYRAWLGDQLGCGPRQTQSNQIAHHGDMYVSMIYAELLQRRMAAHAAFEPASGDDAPITVEQVFTIGCALADLREASLSLEGDLKETLGALEAEDIMEFDPHQAYRFCALAIAIKQVENITAGGPPKQVENIILIAIARGGAATFEVSGRRMHAWAGEAELMLQNFRDAGGEDSDIAFADRPFDEERIREINKELNDDTVRTVFKLTWTMLLGRHFFYAKGLHLDPSRRPPAEASTPTTATCTPIAGEGGLPHGNAPEVEFDEGMLASAKAEAEEEEDDEDEKNKKTSTVAPTVSAFKSSTATEEVVNEARPKKCEMCSVM